MFCATCEHFFHVRFHIHKSIGIGQSSTRCYRVWWLRKVSSEVLSQWRVGPMTYDQTLSQLAGRVLQIWPEILSSACNDLICIPFLSFNHHHPPLGVIWYQKSYINIVVICLPLYILTVLRNSCIEYLLGLMWLLQHTVPTIHYMRLKVSAYITQTMCINISSTLTNWVPARPLSTNLLDHQYGRVPKTETRGQARPWFRPFTIYEVILGGRTI